MKDDYIHPLDRTLSEKILKSKFGILFMEAIFNNHLDEVNSYLYTTSCYSLGEDSEVYQYLLEGCRFFDLQESPQMYVTRSYSYQITCTGMNEPIICIPDVLIKRNDQDILRGRIMSAAASIKAGHHKLTFFSWIYDNFRSVLPIPFMDAVIRSAKNEWYRAQFYTLDRAFYQATGDIELTLRNILYGETSFELFANLTFGDKDSFSKQIEEFRSFNEAVDIVSFLKSYLEEESWLPERYYMIQQYVKGGKDDRN